MLHNYGHRDLIGDIMSWRNDFPDAGQCACNGISKEISGSRRWFCSWVDVLVSIMSFPETALRKSC
jgi:hypothetical protein